MNTLGSRIAQNRKAKGFTQEELAEQLGVSAQAVSKWENDVSCPDITLLPALAKLLGTSVDALLSGETQVVQYVPQELRKPSEEIMLRIFVHDADGDNVRINIPLQTVKVFLSMGIDIGAQNGKSDALSNVDFGQVVTMAEQGMIGKILELETSDGTTVEIVVE